MSPGLLHGRDRPLERLDELASCAAGGHAALVVLSGSAGVGRTALLDASAARLAKSHHVLRSTGSPASRTVPFGALQRLLEPVAARIDPLSGHRPHLLAAALGREPTEDLSDVPLAHLGLALVQFLSLLAEHRPIVVQIDDAAMLDPSSLTLLRFAASRLQDDRVAMVFSASPRRAAQLAAGALPLVELGPLDAPASLAMLHERHPRIAPGLAEWTLDAAGGLPLALVLLPQLLAMPPRSLATAESDDDGAGVGNDFAAHPTAPGEAGVARHSPGLTRRPGGAGHDNDARSAWQIVARRSAELLVAMPDRPRLAALAVSCDELTDDEAARVAAALDLDKADLAEALATPLFRASAAGPRVVHPSLVAVVATPNDDKAARQVHAALASVVGDPARRAHHLARGTTAADEAVAAALSSTAALAASRGAAAEAAEAWELAAERSPQGDALVARLGEGARAHLRAGDTAGFLRMENRLLELTRNDTTRGRIFSARVRAQEARGVVADGDAELERRALIVSGAAPEAAAEILAALAARRLAAGHFGDGQRAARRAQDHERVAASSSATVRETSAGFQAGEHEPTNGGLSPLQLHIELLRSSAEVALGDERAAIRIAHPWERLATDADLADRPLGGCMAARALLWLGHPQRAAALLDRLDLLLRHAPSAARAQVLTLRGVTRIRTGDWLAAKADLGTAMELAALIGSGAAGAQAAAHAGWIAAACGAEGDALKLFARAEHSEPAAPLTRLTVCLGRAMLCLSSGAGAEALQPLAEARRYEELAGLVEPAATTRVGDLCEAAWRSRGRESATADLANFAERAEHLGRASAMAVAERSRGLFTEHAFSEHFERALTLHGNVVDPFERARTELCFAERLSQVRRRREARPPLRTALEVFERLGARPWAERARSRLEACGERRPPSNAPATTAAGGLSMRQLRAARALAEGAGVAEISRELLISRRSALRELEGARAALGVADDAALIARLRA